MTAESDSEDEQQKQERGEGEAERGEGAAPRGGGGAEGCWCPQDNDRPPCSAGREVEEGDGGRSPYAADSDDAATQFHQHYVLPPACAAAKLHPVAEDDEVEGGGGECMDVDEGEEEEEGVAVEDLWGAVEGPETRPPLGDGMDGVCADLDGNGGGRSLVVGDEDVSSSLQGAAPFRPPLEAASPRGTFVRPVEEEEEKGEGDGVEDGHLAAVPLSPSASAGSPVPGHKGRSPATTATMTATTTSPRAPSQAAVRAAGLSMDQRFATFPAHREAWEQHRGRLEGAGLLVPCDSPEDRSARKARFPGLGSDFDAFAPGRVGGRQCTSCSKQVGVVRLG